MTKNLSSSVSRILTANTPIIARVVLGALLLTGILKSSGSFAQSTTAALGTNLSPVTDYSPQLPFVNLFLSSREWFTQCEVGADPGCSTSNSWDTGESSLIDLDPDGWVRTLPSRAATPIFTSVATFWDIPAQFPRGTYLVLYDGAGTIEYGLGARQDTARSRAGRDVLSIDPANGGVLLRISTTDPNNSGNYIRNIRLIAERDESVAKSDTFSSQFLDRLRPYRALRFMDWMQTNNSTAKSWSARSTRSNARYSSAKGVPVEVMVELANTTNASPWFTMPHQADDLFIQSFAQATKSGLSAGLAVYVEYSNEVWNDVFSQGSWVQAQGEAAWPNAAASGFTKRINFYGRRAAEVCDIWRSVFSDTPGRVICVIASQAANSWTASEALTCPLWDQAPCVSHGVKALAIAPYFGDYIGGENFVQSVSAWSRQADRGLQNLFSELASGSVLAGGPAGGALAQSAEWISDNSNVAKQHSVELLAYEGGQHLVGVGSAANNSAITDLFTSANRDDRMQTLYTSYLNQWRARGGGLFMHFNDIGSYSVYGSWGALEEIGQQSSPKYNALWRFSLGTDPPQQSFSLTIQKAGRGVIRSRNAEINCGKLCSATLAKATRITLIATAARGARFRGWSGACKHSRTRCIVTMSRSKLLRASFDQNRFRSR
ncbi:MAG: InlB B-repeat-containing protein [Pseudomonadota bacterium]|jgi:hypothetical protein